MEQTGPTKSVEHYSSEEDYTANTKLYVATLLKGGM